MTVSWAQTAFDSRFLGEVGGGYVVRRFPGAGGPAVTPNAGCAATVSGATAALSCLESGSHRASTATRSGRCWLVAGRRERAVSALVAVPPAPPVLDPVAARNPAAGEAVGDVDLAWSASPGATGYNVYRRTISGFFDFSAPLNGAAPLAATTWIDPGRA